MPYDIAKNDEGTLKRTVGGKDVDVNGGELPPRKRIKLGEEEKTAEYFPALDERLHNIEEHLAVKYGELRNRHLVRYILILSLDCSASTTTFIDRPVDVSRRSSCSPRERLSAVGSFALQTT